MELKETLKPRKTERFIFISDRRLAAAWRDTFAEPAVRFGWRVIAANNRPMGRSANAFDSLAECQADARRVHDAAARIQASVLFRPADSHWLWTASLDAAPVAVCVHLYNRRVECVRALSKFLAAISNVSPLETELRDLGPNAMRAYDPPTGAQTRSAIAQPTVRHTRAGLHESAALRILAGADVLVGQGPYSPAVRS
ncbi:MAG TPA: hypothetical protein VGH11_17400 [Jatrophihabitans sp.]